MKVIPIMLLLFLPFFVRAQIIVTIAGDGSRGSTGDGGLAIHAKLNGPDVFTFDKDGNIYCGEGHRVRKISAATGIITTIAGSGVAGDTGDSGLATNAKFITPDAFVFDAQGNLYIGDAWAFRVRKIDAETGIITTIAGTGVEGYNGDGIPAVNAQVRSVIGMCIDKKGNLYLADWMGNRVRKIDIATGIITTFAGTGGSGYSGDGGPATSALIDPSDVYADSADNIYIADEYNARVRRVDAVTGIITTIAGNGSGTSSGDGGLAINAGLEIPRGIFVDKYQNIFIADEADGRVRRIDAASGKITTVSGTGGPGYSGDGGPAVYAKLSCTDVWVNDDGVLYITDGHINRIRKVYMPETETKVNICLGGTAWLCRNTPTGTWSCSDPQISSIDTFDKIIGLKTGTVTFIHHDTILTETFVVTVSSPPSIAATISPVSCFGTKDGSIATTMNGAGPYQYRWQTGDSTSSVDSLATGIYGLEVTDKLTGCIATDSFAVTKPDSISCEPVLVHNAMTPNGDGINDTWAIENIDNYPNNTVQVFNKWGETVYLRNNYNNDWHAVSIPDGTYYYLIKLTVPTTTNGKNAFTGFLMIKR